MILHKYLSSKYALDYLIKGEIKVSKPIEFNDPFEALPQDSSIWSIPKVKRFLKDKKRIEQMFSYFYQHGVINSKKEFKKYFIENKNNHLEIFQKLLQGSPNWGIIQDIKKNLDKNFRVICFSLDKSKDTDQILMWSHYADSHKGMRIHFDTDIMNIDVYSINYVQERYPFDLALNSNTIQYQRQIEEMILTKSIAWQYEQEYRIFVDPEECISKEVDDRNLYFYKLPLKSIKRVDIGVECSEDDIKTLDLVKQIPLYKEVEFYKAILDEKEYKLNYISLRGQ